MTSMYLNSPWQALQPTRDQQMGRCTPIETENGSLLALVYGTVEDSDCKGAIEVIAAAQDMYKALEAFVDVYDHKSHVNCDRRLCDALDMAKNALAKARGQEACKDDQHRGTECRCDHLIKHCCSHHCCCFTKV